MISNSKNLAPAALLVLLAGLAPTKFVQAQCPFDTLTCPTGELYNRDLFNNCEFPTCPRDTSCDSASTGTGENYLICRNGEFTARDPNKNCEFTSCDGGCLAEDYQQCTNPYLNIYAARDPNTNCVSYLGCPQAITTASSCPQDVLTCPTGEIYNRDPSNNCEFPTCPRDTSCDSASTGTGENYLICRNGEFTTRDPNTNCEFTSCDGGCLAEDYQQCPNPYLNIYAARDPNTNCVSYLDCPQPVTFASSCPQDVLTCPAGEVYNRDPYNNCEFPICPRDTSCDSASTGTGENYLICRNGEFTTRDPNNNCEFTSCDGGCLAEDYQQCPNPHLNIYAARDPNTNCVSYLDCPQASNLPTTFEPDGNEKSLSGAGGMFVSSWIMIASCLATAAFAAISM